MRKVITYVHIHDAGTAHDPSNGQFTSGSGGGSSSKPKRKPMSQAEREYTIKKNIEARNKQGKFNNPSEAAAYRAKQNSGR